MMALNSHRVPNFKNLFEYIVYMCGACGRVCVHVCVLPCLRALLRPYVLGCFRAYVSAYVLACACVRACVHACALFIYFVGSRDQSQVASKYLYLLCHLAKLWL